MASVTNVIIEILKYRKEFRNVFVIDSRGSSTGPAWLFPFYFICAIWRFLMIVGARRVCLLHLQVSERSSFIRKGLLLTLGQAFGIRVVLHHHGAELISYYRSAPRPLRRWTSWVSRRADVNVVLGEKWKTFLEQEVGVEPDRVVVIYNAVPDHSNGIAEEVKAVRKQGEPFRFLFLGHVTSRKGIDQLLHAIKILQQRGVDCHVTIAGNGELERYQDMARDAGVFESCTFTGWVSHFAVAELLRSSEALVLPSFEEGLPMAILEALSWGVPVISTPVGSIGEVLSNGKNCLLIPPGDALAVADAMQLLAMDPELCLRIGANGRQLFLERFTVDAFAERLLAAYDLAFGTKRPAQLSPM